MLGDKSIIVPITLFRNYLCMCRSSLNKQLEHRGSVLGIFASPDAGTDWGQEKGMTEDEMAGWHHRLDAHEFG